MVWEQLIQEEKAKDYYQGITASLAKVGEYYPPKTSVFRAMKLTPFDRVKVVILGQDPYHGGQANGLAFAVNPEFPVPPSLQNIFKEIAAEYGQAPKSRTLENWASQGVLLLNAVLTVTKAQALSHRDFGWQKFTDRVIAELGKDPQPRVFLLWGAQARSKKALIQGPSLALESVHPSPLSAYNGFFGCGHFKKANDFLESHGMTPIDWINS